MEQNCSLRNYLPDLLRVWLWPLGFTYLEGRYSDTLGLTGNLYYLNP
jgi:hypothetical protein